MIISTSKNDSYKTFFMFRGQVENQRDALLKMKSAERVYLARCRIVRPLLGTGIFCLYQSNDSAAFRFDTWTTNTTKNRAK